MLDKMTTRTLVVNPSNTHDSRVRHDLAAPASTAGCRTNWAADRPNRVSSRPKSTSSRRRPGPGTKSVRSTQNLLRPPLTPTQAQIDPSTCPLLDAPCVNHCEAGEQTPQKAFASPCWGRQTVFNIVLTGPPAAFRLQHEQPGNSAIRAATGRHGVVRKRVIHGRNQMNRTNTKMKLLALGLLGLGGIAVAGSAAAQTCPSNPVPPWSGKTALSGGSVTISTGGLDASSCKLDTSVGTSAVSLATVNDTSPSNEPRYRVQFLVNAAALGTIGSLDGVQLFNANAQSSYPASGGRRPLVTVSLSPAGSGTARLTIIASCNNSASAYRCITSTPALAAGTNRLELDLQVGAGSAGVLRYWLNSAAGTSEPTPTGTITNLDNAGWVGVNDAFMGLSAATPAFRSAHNGQVVSFDTFDSRRQTYIGH